jgi:hypothetical protein
MATADSIGLSRQEQRVLWRAVSILEGQSFVARLTDLTGEPITQFLQALPAPLTRQINRAVRNTLSQALDVALYKMGSGRLEEPPAVMFTWMSGVTGGLSGFFGLGALAVELPVTTTLMLRSIAGIARRQGENLDDPASRLACLEVFALGQKERFGPSGQTSYYAVRAFLAKTVTEAAQNFMERGIAGGSAPFIVELISSIGSRFGLVVSEKVAAGAIPVIGAVGGAAVNLAFMKHFQLLAIAHFSVRRLERDYGQELIRSKYQVYARLLKERNTKPLPRAKG